MSRRNEEANRLRIKNKQTKSLCSRWTGVAGRGDSGATGVAEPRLAKVVCCLKMRSFETRKLQGHPHLYRSHGKW